MSQLEEIELICVTCPKGCKLDIIREGDTFVKITAGCKRGKEYARQELTDPRRMVATTVKVNSGLHPLVPVYTASAFPKPKIYELLSILRELQLDAPIHINQVVLADALGTGIDVIASRDLPASSAI
jgi:CxxC motif-containing protein